MSRRSAVRPDSWCGPRTVSTPPSICAVAPISTRTSTICAPGWVVWSGQSGMETSPPVAAAAATNAAALERSGSIRQSTAATGPGTTRHVFATPASTVTPAVRSISIVMSMCGWEGTGFPTWWMVTPASNRAAEMSSPETNCDDDDASMVTSPPRTEPVPAMPKGSVRPSTATPRSRRADRMVSTGRARICSSPSTVTVPWASAAIGGTKRMTVPANPQSTCPPVSASGVMVTVVGSAGSGRPRRRAWRPRRA